MERVSCSRIRMSVLTETVGLGKENISTIANCFAKHSEKVLQEVLSQAFFRKGSRENLLGLLKEI